MKKLSIILLILSLTSIPFAAGHPFTEETIPSSTSNAPVGVNKVIVYFSESVEIDFSRVSKFLTVTEIRLITETQTTMRGEESLIVTTPPLEDGIYTVSTKVLSKVDGHLVPDAFVFAVGDVAFDPNLVDSGEKPDLVFLEEADPDFQDM